MIIILASWVFILVNCYLFGFVLNNILKLKSSLSLTIILGVISITTFANIFSFFGPIDSSFLFKIGIISTIYLIIYSNEIKLQLLQFKKEIFSYKNIVLLIFSAILFSAYSSGNSNINDDGLYYIQTIMWLREYGLIHGISNLHLSLGLSSSWHVFQAVFTFSENINLNDVNGFLMLVFTIFTLEYSSKKDINYLWFFQFVFVLLISIPFYSAPNPDFAIIVFTAICIQLFAINKNSNNVILLICAFCITIKLSAITVTLLAIYLLFQSLKNASFKILSKLMLVLITIVFLHIGKNIYQTAYPLYPYKILSLNLDWKTPEPIVNYFTNGVKTWSYSNKLNPIDIEQLNETSQIEILKKIVFRNGSKGIINKLIFASFIFCIIIIIYKLLKNKSKIKEIELQIVIGLSLIIWFVIAPQYRFALPMLIFYLAFIIYTIYSNLFLKLFKLNLYIIHLIIIAILFIPTVFGMNIGGNETSSQIGKINKIKSKQLILPIPKYKFDKMDTLIINNSNFYHTNGNMYCWNSPLPCMSKGYEKTIYDNFKYRISLRGNSLKEGFKFIKY